MLFVLIVFVILSGVNCVETYVTCSDHTNLTSTQEGHSGSCGAEIHVKCSNNKSVTELRPSKDGVGGRYELEWCTEMAADHYNWAIEVTYSSKKPHTCGYLDLHTTSHMPVDKSHLNCSHVCLTFTPVDLIFSACYIIHNWFLETRSRPIEKKVNISNEYTMQSFMTSNFSTAVIYHENYVSVHFHMGIVPVLDYNVHLEKLEGNNSAHVLWQKSVKNQCKHSLYEILCELPVSEGSYKAWVDFFAPWTKNPHFQKSVRVDFTVERRAAQVVEGVGSRASRAALWWACGALAALCAAAAALLLALRWRRVAAARKHVLRDWLHRVENKSATAEAPSPAGPILLLYARECAQAEPVIEALAALLETAAPGQVYDIGSAKTLALAASGGGEWVRSVMARPETRVVLLQTPALQALHTPRLVADHDSLKLEQPLLSHRAVYRAPAAADWLLQYALRLLAHTAHAPPAAHPYRKYYLATLEGLETEVLQYAVPFRRYVLPAHAAVLAADLAPPSQPPPPSPSPSPPPHPPLQHLVDTLAHAAVGFKDYVQANPDYLMEELLIL